MEELKNDDFLLYLENASQPEMKICKTDGSCFKIRLKE
jgi:hypothetical protein